MRLGGTRLDGWTNVDTGGDRRQKQGNMGLCRGC